MPELCLSREEVSQRVVRLLLRLAAASLLLFGVAGCGADADVQPAQLRVVHVSTHAGNLDVLARSSGGAVAGVAYDLSFGSVTTYFPLQSSMYVASSETRRSLAEIHLNTAAARHSTMLLQDSVAGIQPNALLDQDQPASPGHFSVRFVNATQENGAVDLYLVPPGQAALPTTVTTAGPGKDSHSGYVELPSGTYTLYVMPAGVPLRAGAPLYAGSTVDYASGAVRTVIVLAEPQPRQTFNEMTLHDAEPFTSLSR